MSQKGKEKFLAILHRYMEIHGTVYYETQRPPEVPAFVKNHGLLPQQELQQLLRKAKVGEEHNRGFHELIWLNMRSSGYNVMIFFFIQQAIHWIWLPLRRSRPSGGHSQWLHLPPTQVQSPSQLSQS